MNVVARQTFKSTVYIYAGVGIGFVSNALLMPQYLTPDQIGAIGLLVSYSMILSSLGALGFQNTIIKFFPYFRDPERKHHGFLVLTLGITLAGAVLAVILFLILKPVMVNSNAQDSPLFVTYINYIIPLIFFQLLFGNLDYYNRALYNASTGTFLKEFFQRLLIIIALVPLIYQWYTYREFVRAYVAAFGVIACLIIIYLLVNQSFLLRWPDFRSINQKVWKSMTSLSLFGLLNGMSSLIITRIDSVMLNEYYSTYETGIYVTLMYFGTIVIMPSRALRGIAPTVIGQAFKENNLPEIATVHRESAVNQYLIGSLLVVGLWVNINNIFFILPAAYETGKYVVLFIGLMNLVKMGSGLSEYIINYSRYYKYRTGLTLFLVVLIILSNYLLIPVYGISGAAFASLLSIFINRLVYFILVKRFFNINPIGYRHLLITGIALFSYGAGWFVPQIRPFFLDILARSALVGAIFISLTYLTHVSPDLNRFIHQIFKKMK